MSMDRSTPLFAVGQFVVVQQVDLFLTEEQRFPDVTEEDFAVDYGFGGVVTATMFSDIGWAYQIDDSPVFFPEDALKRVG